MDLSKLSDTDLSALEAGDLSKVSDGGLAALEAQQAPAAPAKPSIAEVLKRPEMQQALQQGTNLGLNAGMGGLIKGISAPQAAPPSPAPSAPSAAPSSSGDKLGALLGVISPRTKHLVDLFKSLKGSTSTPGEPPSIPSSSEEVLNKMSEMANKR